MAGAGNWSHRGGSRGRQPHCKWSGSLEKDFHENNKLPIQFIVSLPLTMSDDSYVNNHNNHNDANNDKRDINDIV